MRSGAHLADHFNLTDLARLCRSLEDAHTIVAAGAHPEETPANKLKRSHRGPDVWLSLTKFAMATEKLLFSCWRPLS